MARLSLEELREQVPVTKEVGYFQTGTYGPALASVVKAVGESMEYEAMHGPARPSTRQFIMEKEEAARGQPCRAPERAARRAGTGLEHYQVNAPGPPQHRLAGGRRVRHYVNRARQHCRRLARARAGARSRRQGRRRGRQRRRVPRVDGRRGHGARQAGADQPRCLAQRPHNAGPGGGGHRPRQGRAGTRGRGAVDRPVPGGRAGSGGAITS